MLVAVGLLHRIQSCGLIVGVAVSDSGDVTECGLDLMRRSDIIHIYNE
jgi:hypothetical protein